MKFSTLLRNGALAGLAAGVVAALIQWLHTEPVIRRALTIEDRRGALEHAAAGAHGHEEGLVGRTSQVIVGMCTAGVAAVLFGIIFAVVFAKAGKRIPGIADHSRALWLAAMGFFAFTLMPALAIPSNPPAVGDPDTITRRTLIYVLAILVGVLIIGATAFVHHALEERGTDVAQRVAVSSVTVAVLVPVALALIPNSPDTIPTTGDASLIAGADLIWDFRIASLFQLGSMWLVLGAVFGVLTTRKASVASSRSMEPLNAS